MTIILTPNGALPETAGREARPGYMWSVDGRREVEWGTVPCAWELAIYCTRAYAAADYFAVLAERPGVVGQLATLDLVQATRSLVSLLPILADAYDAAGIPTSSYSAQASGHIDKLISPEGVILRSFKTTDDWRDLADDLDYDVLRAHSVTIPATADNFGAVPVVVWAIIALVGGVLVVAGAYAWTIGKITAYAGRELDVFEARAACFDRWAEEYANTGSDEARDAMLLCHQQAIELAPSGILDGILWPLAGLAGIVAVITLTKRN